MQLVSAEERQARIDFYRDHSIGWVARPKHGENGYVRKGKFKKASNMNFALNISNQVEAKLKVMDRSEEWDQYDEAQAYERCLIEVLDDDKRAWADGNIRMGDYIVLSTYSDPVQTLDNVHLSFTDRLSSRFRYPHTC